VYKVILLPDSEKSFRKLTKSVQKRITSKIDWLKENADKIIHHSLVGLPEDLRGLYRLRVGDYRVLYWIYKKENLIKIYEIEHRSEDYRSIRK
jgi:mRNA interferase RelE/StbE